VRALPARAAVAVLVAAADLWLGLRWLRPGAARSGRAAPRATSDKPAGRWYARSPRRAVLRRLVWQHWRQSWKLMAALGLLAAPAVLLMIHDRWPGRFPRLLRPTWDSAWVLAGIAAWAVPCLIGASVFVADRRGHGYRFLAERGVRPALVWLSRHLVWAPVAGVGLATALLLIPWPSPSPRTTLEAFPYAAAIVVFFMLAYAAGQFWSMLLRSGILAGFSAIVSTAVLWSWAWLMWRLGLAWWWSVAPIPLVLMLATWLHCGDWLLEWTGWRARLRVWLPVALVAVLLLGAFPLVRVYEVPAVEMPFPIEEITRAPTAQEAATGRLYEQACPRFVAWEAFLRSHGKDDERDPEKVRAMEQTCSPERRAWVKANERALALVVEASRMPAPWYLTPTPPSWKVNVPVYLDKFGSLLLERAAQRTADGNLDGAWADLLAALRVSVHMRRSLDECTGPDSVETDACVCLADWAARPGQSPERLRRALRQYEALLATIPSPEVSLKWEYALRRQSLAHPDTAARAQWEPGARFRAAIDAGWMPWEKARAWRVLNLTAAQDFAALREVERALAEGRPAAAPSEEFVLRQYRLWDTTPALSPWFSPEGHSLVARYLRMETRRRAATLLLALEAWKAQHGRFPDTLDELAGTYLNRLPLDPYSGKPFGYRVQRSPAGPKSGVALLESVGPTFDADYGWFVAPALGADRGVEEHLSGFEGSLQRTNVPEEERGQAARGRPWCFVVH
jgi:hypothetical protein